MAIYLVNIAFQRLTNLEVFFPRKPYINTAIPFSPYPFVPVSTHPYLVPAFKIQRQCYFTDHTRFRIFQVMLDNTNKRLLLRSSRHRMALADCHEYGLTDTVPAT